MARTASTSTASKTTSKKRSAGSAALVPPPPPPVVTNDDLEPLGPVYADDDEDGEPVTITASSPFESANNPAVTEADDDEDHAAEEHHPVARNVGSLLTNHDDGDELENTGGVPAPAVVRQVVRQGAPTKGTQPHAAAIYWEEAKRIGPAHSKATLLRKLVARVSLHMEEIQKWGDADPNPVAAVGGLRAARSSLEGAISSLTALPVGWAPPAKVAASGPKTLAAGTRVFVKEANRSEYDGALEPDEMTGLTVVRHDEGKPKVACTTAGGSRVVISRAHLAVEAIPEKNADEE